VTRPGQGAEASFCHSKVTTHERGAEPGGWYGVREPQYQHPGVTLFAGRWLASVVFCMATSKPPVPGVRREQAGVVRHFGFYKR
jgi:hypothetical protein